MCVCVSVCVRGTVPEILRSPGSARRGLCRRNSEGLLSLSPGPRTRPASEGPQPGPTPLAHHFPSLPLSRPGRPTLLCVAGAAGGRLSAAAGAWVPRRLGEERARVWVFVAVCGSR